MAELKDLLFTWLNKSICTKRCLQSLTGKLLWVARCVKHSRCFLSRLLSGLKTLAEQHHKLSLTPDMKLDILWWYTYIREFNGVSFLINPSIITNFYAGVEMPARLLVVDIMNFSTGAGCCQFTCRETSLQFI